MKRIFELRSGDAAGHLQSVPVSFPPAGRVQVHIIDPAAFPAEVAIRVLNAAEQELAGRFRFEKDAVHWRACRAALKMILGKALEIDPSAVTLATGDYGKPFLEKTPRPIHFNLSHCHDLALLALAGEGPVGVDVEPADRAGSLLGCEGTFCHPDEIAALPAGEGRATALLDIWTSKEALLKALGTGMSLAPQTVFVGGGTGSSHPRLDSFVLRRLQHPALRLHMAKLATGSKLIEMDILIFQ